MLTEQEEKQLIKKEDYLVHNGWIYSGSVNYFVCGDIKYLTTKSNNFGWYHWRAKSVLPFDVTWMTQMYWDGLPYSFDGYLINKLVNDIGREFTLSPLFD